jgi:hypothetical protein
MNGSRHLRSVDGQRNATLLCATHLIHKIFAERLEGYFL